MKDFCQKRWARTLALVLFCLLVPVSFACGFLYNYGLQDGWYGGTDGFEDSTLCRSYIQDCLDYVAENLLWLGDPTDTTLGEYGGNAFSYTITQLSTGLVTADTTTASSVYVMDYGDSSYGEAAVIDLTGDVIAVPDYDTAASEDSASASDAAAYEYASEYSESEYVEWAGAEAVYYGDDGTVYYLYYEETSYIISGYVNLPVEPYDGCYGEYLTFTRLYAGRDYYLALCVGCGAMALLLLAFALAGAILAGKNGRKPLRLLRLPLEPLALGLYLCALLLWNGAWDLAFDLVFKTVGLYIPCIIK